MALPLGALRDALVAAGVDHDKADRAAEEAAGYVRLEVEMARLADRIGRLTAVTSILGVAMIAILVSQLTLWQQMGQLDGQLSQIGAQVTEIVTMLRQRAGG